MITFATDPVWKKQLLNGFDDIDLTLSEAATISRFTEPDERRRPWMKPASGE